MKERPILFSGPMVRAILAGTKTQTRRLVKPGDWSMEAHTMDTDWPYLPHYLTDGEAVPVPCPYGKPGDWLAPAMPIPSLNRNYCADLSGRIWSRASDGQTWKPLKGSPTDKGYLSITPAHEGRYRTRLVHRLVAEAFYGYEPNRLKQVRHLNGNQSDNAPENLDWGSQEDNWSDRYAHGRGCGEQHHASRLTTDDVTTIKYSSASQRALAKRFGVAQSTVWAIKSGLYWQENPKANPPNCPRWASRITLEITSVRVERLLNISETDAQAEGIDLQGFRSQTEGIAGREHRIYFRDLWESINGAGSWDVNPFVWVVTFRQINRA